MISPSKTDFLRLLGSVSGIKGLLTSGQELGIKIKTNAWSNIVDFGVFSTESLRSTVPIGYEGMDSKPSDGYLMQRVILSLDGSGQHFHTFTLNNTQSLPTDEKESFQLQVVTEDGEDATGLTLRAGDELTLYVRLTIRPQYTKGHINEFVLLSFTSQRSHSPVCSSSAQCTVGVKVQGALMAPQEVAISRQLSAEAVPFTPQVATTYFDVPCPLSTMANSAMSSPEENYSAPQGFKNVQFPELQHDPIMIQDYVNVTPNDFVTKYLAGGATSHEFDGTTKTHMNYLRNQRILNAMEFVQMDKDIRFFDLRYSSVSFKILPPAQPNSDPKYMTCSLIVKGANENRPMINIGDFIRFRPVGEDLLAHCLPMLELEAVVTGFTLKSEKVTCVLALPNMEQTYLNHPPAFPHHAVKVLSELRFHIRFTFDKCGVAFVQKAIDTISESTALKLRVFPPKEREVRNPLPRLLQFPGRIIMDPDLNREQREAVETVSALYLAGVDSYKADRNCTPSPPYIIFGPPGTGKTKTLVSVIRGLVAVGRAEGRHPRVLACAPSDAAADVLCTRLAKYFTTDELFRLNWWQRPRAAVPLHLHAYCHITDARFDLPIRKLPLFQIIVSTSVAAGVMDATFDLVVLDEVSQATEGESLVPVSLVKPSGVVVLSGDPEQLGPVPRSPLFRAADMHLSLQERLLQHRIYENIRPYFGPDEEDGARVTERDMLCKFGVYLRHNYRSQKTIFETSSSLFYHNSLIESGAPEVLDSLAAWEELPEPPPRPRPFLVLFRSITSGMHQHERDSPSFFNISEISCVVQLCSSLISSGKVTVTPQDIGVIGAFRAQVLKLRLALRSVNLGGINVGGIEDFQGQESRIIIISTVLSSRVRQLEINERLGLCGDHRKFNVAVTRGKSLCVVVGNPHYLHGDPSWRQLMNFCDSNGTFTGDPCSLLARVQREEQEEEDILRAAASAALLDMGSNGAGSMGFERFANPYYGSELEWRGLL